MTEAPTTTDETTPDTPDAPVLDVDVSELSTRHRKGERTPPIPEGYWVLIGEHDDVDERYWGHIAAVVQSKQVRCDCDWSTQEHTHQDPNQDLIVVTRDQYNSRIELPLDAVKEFAQDRVTLHPYA